jgi:hypothetical protein
VDGPDWSGTHWVGSSEADGLAAGDSQWYSFSWTVPSDSSVGTYEYYAQVWHGGDPASPSVSKQSFDLECMFAEVTSTWPVNGATCGENARLWAQVTNTGEATIPSGTKIWFWAGGPGWDGSHWLGYADVDAMVAGESGWYAFDWSIPDDASPGAYTYYGQVWYGETAVSEWSDAQDFDVACN